MTDFLSELRISSGTRELSQTSPGHQQLLHLTHTTSPSINGGSGMLLYSVWISKVTQKPTKGNQTFQENLIFVYTT